MALSGAAWARRVPSGEHATRLPGAKAAAGPLLVFGLPAVGGLVPNVPRGCIVASSYSVTVPSLLSRARQRPSGVKAPYRIGLRSGVGSEPMRWPVAVSQKPSVVGSA